MLVMERYNLSSDPCDYMLIQISNCLQCLACICNILAVVGIPFAKESACLVNIIADIVYGVVTGCMTAQVMFEVFAHKCFICSPHPIALPLMLNQTAHEINYQLSTNNPGKHVPLDGKVRPVVQTVEAVPM